MDLFRPRRDLGRHDHPDIKLPGFITRSSLCHNGLLFLDQKKDTERLEYVRAGRTQQKEVCQNILVPALAAGPQKNRPYQSDIYTVSLHAIPRQAREQGSFDTPSSQHFNKKMQSSKIIRDYLCNINASQ